MKRNLSLLVFGCVISATALLAQGDPPSRVARLNFIEGSVSMEPAGSDDWVPAIINRPFTTGDYLYTDQGGRAEMHFDNGVIRASQYTSFGFLNLDDHMTQIKLGEGQFNLHVRSLGDDQAIEIDTPNAAISILREGDYRVDVNPHDGLSFVVVRRGEAEVTGGGQAFAMHPGDAAQVTGTDSLAYDLRPAPAFDEFDNFCSQRDQRFARVQSTRYVSDDVIGYEDLDDNGSWRTDGTYGAVWYPRTVQAGWAPYRYGHWAWIEPWGWTWVDDAPWGFAPFHYGRWVYVGGGWGWSPGPIAVVEVGRPRPRPCYAPALVAFIGGIGWGVSVSVGGPSVGWVPLGWGEVYRPAYHVSPAYFQTVNVNNTVINKTVNITNVYNTTYVNKTVINNTTVTNTYVNMRAPNAVTAMPQQAFASGQPSARAGVSLRGDQVAKVQPNATVLAPPVAPTRTAVAPNYQARGPAPHPEAAVMQRPVVAKTTPPPPPPSFQAKQAYLAKNVGQPFNAQQLKQTVQPTVQPQNLVRKAPPVTAAAVQQRPVVPPSPTSKNAPQTAERPAQQPNAPVQPQPTVHPVVPPSGNPPNNENKTPNAHGVPPNQVTPQTEARPNTPVPPKAPPAPTHQNQAAPPHVYPPQAPHEPQPPAHVAPPPPKESQKTEKKDDKKKEKPN